MTLGTANNIALVSPDAAFEDPFDLNNPDYVNGVYENIGTSDCVIAARAHHTIRLDYNLATKILVIDPKEVKEEFLLESGGSDSLGVNPFDSLRCWKSRGWIAGAAMGFKQMRQIADFDLVDVPGMGDDSGNPMPQTSIDSVKSAIVSHSGLHFTLNLPGDVRPPDNRSVGLANHWTNLSGSGTSSHTMLLTGYDVLGPIGITWGQRQRMSWDFLYKYGAALFWVLKGANT